MHVFNARLPALIAAAMVAYAMTSCTGASLPSGSRITPDYFKYATIIPAPADGSRGGWRAVCIKASTGQRIAHPTGVHVLGTHTQCGLEFGSPIVNRQHGHIPLHMAQRISADVANEVAYAVLSKERGVTAVTCRKLVHGMNKLLGIRINGSKVNQCGVTNWSHNVPEVPWP